MLLARRPERLKPDEKQLLAKLNECCPEIPILYELTQGFATVFLGKCRVTPYRHGSIKHEEPAYRK